MEGMDGIKMEILGTGKTGRTSDPTLFSPSELSSI